MVLSFIFDFSKLVLFINADLFNVIIDYIKSCIVIDLTIIIQLLQSYYYMIDYNEYDLGNYRYI
jgi:hypothetical protein